MGTCLGPRRDKDAIYISLLDQIYQEADDIEVNEATGSQMYEEIKSKLTKKSLFKKLIDHLSSHRNFLNDCMQQNFRIMRSKKTFVGRTTCLIIVDEFVQNLEQFTNLPILPRNNSTHHHKHNHPTPEAMVHRDIDFRFQTIYFQVIIDIYDLEHKLREEALKSVVTFCQKRENCFGCDELVAQMLQKLIQGITQKKSLQQYTRTYEILLSKSNENSQDIENCQQALKTLMKLWMIEEDQEIKVNCALAIKIYISRCLTSRQYMYVFTIIFQIYDANFFKKNQVGQFELKILDILKNEDLRDQFLKGMFKYLITYLCVCQNQQTRSKWQLGIFELPYDTVKRNFTNITLKQTKKNGFETMLRWIHLGFINIGDVVAYNRNTFVYCFLFNLSTETKQKQLVSSIVTTFEQIIKMCDSVCIAMMFEILMDELYKTKDVEISSIVYQIALKCIKEKDFIDSATSDQYQIYIRPLNDKLPTRTLSQIIDLVAQLIKTCDPNLCQPLFEAICIMIQSLPDLLISNTLSAYEKYILTESIYFLMKNLYDKKEQELLIAFIDQLRQTQADSELSDIDQYMHRIIAYEIYSIFTGKKQMPGQMQTINSRFKETVDLEQIKEYLASDPLWHENKPNIKIEVFRRQSNKKRVELIKRYFDRLQKLKQKDEQPQIQVRLSLRHKNSIVDRPSTRGDESFDDIYGLIKEGSF